MLACSSSLTPRLIATEFFLLQCGQVRSTRMCVDTRFVAIWGLAPTPLDFLTLSKVLCNPVSWSIRNLIVSYLLVIKELSERQLRSLIN
jgi:hypothetical protein